MTNLEKIQQWINLNPQIQLAEIVSQITETLFLVSIDWVEGVELRNGGYDVEIGENDTITFLPHIR